MWEVVQFFMLKNFAGECSFMMDMTDKKGKFFLKKLLPAGIRGVWFFSYVLELLVSNCFLAGMPGL